MIRTVRQTRRKRRRGRLRGDSTPQPCRRGTTSSALNNDPSIRPVPGFLNFLVICLTCRDVLSATCQRYIFEESRTVEEGETSHDVRTSGGRALARGARVQEGRPRGDQGRGRRLRAGASPAPPR